MHYVDLEAAEVGVAEHAGECLRGGGSSQLLQFRVVVSVDRDHQGEPSVGHTGRMGRPPVRAVPRSGIRGGGRTDQMTRCTQPNGSSARPR